MTLATNWVDNIGMFVNAAYLNQVGTESNANTNARPLYGTFSARPAANTVTAGTPYYCSDTDTLYRSDGTNWIKVQIGANSCTAMGDVPTTGWTGVNMQTGASFAADKDDMKFTSPSQSTAQLQFQYRAYPTPPFTLTAYIDADLATVSSANSQGQVGLAISDGTKYILFGPQFSYGGTAPFMAAGWGVWASQWTTNSSSSTPGTYGSASTWSEAMFGGMPKWYQLVDNGTNIICQVSMNGIDWQIIGTAGRTSFLTPSRIGVGAYNWQIGQNMLMRLRSWNGVS